MGAQSAVSLENTVKFTTCPNPYHVVRVKQTCPCAVAAGMDVYSLAIGHKRTCFPITEPPIQK